MDKLLAQECYYRPTRARELRRIADVLESWFRCLLGLGLLVIFSGCAVPFAVGQDIQRYLPQMLPIWVAAWGLCAAVFWLFQRSERCRQEADDLDLEHRAKYGPSALEGPR